MEDQELLGYFRETGDNTAVSILMDRYRDLILGMAMNSLHEKEGVEDFSNDMFIKLAEYLRDHPVDNFRNWLGTAVKRRLIDLSRKRSTRTRFAKEAQKQDGGEEIDGGLAFTMDQSLIFEAINQLSKKEKDVIQALYFEELSYFDAGEELGLTFNQVRGTRERALNKLRGMLGEDFDQYFED